MRIAMLARFPMPLDKITKQDVKRRQFIVTMIAPFRQALLCRGKIARFQVDPSEGKFIMTAPREMLAR